MSAKEQERKKYKGLKRGTGRQHRQRQPQQEMKPKRKNAESGIDSAVAQKLNAEIIAAKRTNPDFEAQAYEQLVEGFNALNKYLKLLKQYGIWYERTMEKLSNLLKQERVCDSPTIARRAKALDKAIAASPRSRSQVLGLLKSLLKAYCEEMKAVLEKLRSESTVKQT